jgi:hypothetical protein
LLKSLDQLLIDIQSVVSVAKAAQIATSVFSIEISQGEQRRHKHPPQALQSSRRRLPQ